MLFGRRDCSDRTPLMRSGEIHFSGQNIDITESGAYE
jgi:hypothetical protein